MYDYVRDETDRVPGHAHVSRFDNVSFVIIGRDVCVCIESEIDGLCS